MDTSVAHLYLQLRELYKKNERKTLISRIQVYCETACSRNVCINKTETVAMPMDMFMWKVDIL